MWSCPLSKKYSSLKLELVLIISSIGIDKNQSPAVGPSSKNRLSVSKDTIIFIRQLFIEWYGDLRQWGFNDLSIRETISIWRIHTTTASAAQVPQNHRLSSFSIISYLRKRLCSWPVTIWTFADHNTVYSFLDKC